MQFRDYYETLGVARGASQDDIKRAYRRLARKFHPDVSKEANAESRFKEVGEAYEVLKDPEKRAAYDRFGKDWKHGQEFRPPPGWERQFNFGGGGFPGGSGFSDFFETLFGQGAFHGARGPMRAKGGNQSARVEIPLDDAYRGATRNITIHGRTLSVRIPRGVTEGQRIRLGGQGRSGSRGRPGRRPLSHRRSQAASAVCDRWPRRASQAPGRSVGSGSRSDNCGAYTRGQGRSEDSPWLPGGPDAATEGPRTSRASQRRPVRHAGDRHAARRHPGGGVAVPADGGVDALRPAAGLSEVTPSARGALPGTREVAIRTPHPTRPAGRPDQRGDTTEHRFRRT